VLSEKVTRRRLKLVETERAAQFRSGDTNRIGGSGDSGGDESLTEVGCSISSSDWHSSAVSIESKLRLLEKCRCTMSSSLAVFPREFNRVLCSKIAVRMGVGGTVVGYALNVGTGQSRMSSKSNEKDLRM